MVKEIDLGTKIPLDSQVGGHAGISASEDGSLLIKPASVREISFYRHLAPDPVFASLRPYIPRFYGILGSDGKIEDGNLETLRETPKGGKDEYLLLESPSGDRPRIYRNDTFNSIGESVQWVPEAEYPRHQTRNEALRR